MTSFGCIKDSKSLQKNVEEVEAMTVERLIVEYCVKNPDTVVTDSGCIEYRYSWDDGCMQMRMSDDEDNQWERAYTELNMTFSSFIRQLIVEQNDLPF